MENVTQLDWSDDKCKNGDDIPKTLLDDTDYIDRIIPSCNPENTCEVIQDFLGEQTSIHYSLWYYEFKEEKTKRILEIEKRLFELKDEHLDLIQELHNIQDDLLVRLNKTLK